VSLAEPAPSGSTDTLRLCRGCSHPPRHLPDQAAPSFTTLLRQDSSGGLSPPLEQQAPHGAHSGKHKRHGVNVQLLADPAGRLVWASPALPGAVHDLTAARTHGIPAALVKFGVAAYADAAYQAAGPTIAVPYRRHPSRCHAIRRSSTVTTPATGHPANEPLPR
jgi:hypothetical protein